MRWTLTLHLLAEQDEVPFCHYPLESLDVEKRWSLNKCHLKMGENSRPYHVDELILKMYLPQGMRGEANSLSNVLAFYVHCLNKFGDSSMDC